MKAVAPRIERLYESEVEHWRAAWERFEDDLFRPLLDDEIEAYCQYSVAEAWVSFTRLSTFGSKGWSPSSSSLTIWARMTKPWHDLSRQPRWPLLSITQTSLRFMI